MEEKELDVDGMSVGTEKAVESALHFEKSEQEAHGHTWDISDAMSALRSVGIESHEEIKILIKKLHELYVIDLTDLAEATVWNGADRRHSA